ncbi:hypothetical protein OU995_10465 [Roseateles sp. SL47]|uniref:hypothetical protein n=1 Tax=Roseateles sp. SL47 TaxID=2995138 RepID=UPI002271BEFE|nr:hypothetical protein [Roseateles sp. SL47]WAC75087.1 hypothetical protein OU995_10465 [Roseateles sp. SL47]
MLDTPMENRTVTRSSPMATAFKTARPAARTATSAATSAAAFIAALTAASPTVAQDLSASSWRRTDTTLVQLCLDGLEGDQAPKSLSIQTVADGTTVSGSYLDLVGFTTTERPIYQGSIEHPSRNWSTFVQLPNTTVRARIDRPDKLEKYIDIWRDAAVASCTADPQAAYKALRGSGQAPELTACPDMGLHVSLKVTSSSEQALDRIRLREKGPSHFNGLRGCRDFIYGTVK